ncbi:acyltransferase family protein [Legionella micdadei]|uniref:Peptidoglycan/LPS O-acetylase OafA/YrhL, contains acyltransferase and SGNH-hydrolase domains n=1 Tax=Legionella micdadei TaxID=451 RepID=A0A098GK15_LEGMI|nr:acyltransferase [Legionella micdadei]ARG98731.1 acyltransferase [Legionella micdadei]ARH01450.1 acyltransferase [Legionella micdadei]KTD28950.1 O-acetyltransferase [Legionella micdadei]NSL17162.1 acyltransferase [Legionella micdadei]CEG62332.1 membrane protein of unknown function [Legionella micdadei]
MVPALDRLKTAIPGQKSISFSPEIESLRGVASLAVVMGHLYLFLFMPILGFNINSSHESILNLLVAGIFDPQPAVLLFFTISGLVLGRQLRKEPIVDFFSFLAYLCRRAFRLIPLMWTTTILAFFLWNSMNRLDPSVLRATLLLNDIGINVPLWSLKVELYCSLIFPIIFLLFEFGGKLINLLLFALFTTLSFYWHEPIYIQFLVFFHAGLLVDRIAKATYFIPQGIATLLLGLAITVLLLAPEFSIGNRNWMHGYWQSWVLPEIVACPFILLFIASQPSSNFNAFLRLTPIRYLGKISFSIYLIHFPVFLYMKNYYPLTGTLLNSLGFLISYLTVVITLSSLTFRWIEIPSNELGKRLSSYILKASRRTALLTE